MNMAVLQYNNNNWLSERFDEIGNFFFRRMYVFMSVRSLGHSFQAILMKLGTRIPLFLT